MKRIILCILTILGLAILYEADGQPQLVQVQTTKFGNHSTLVLQVFPQLDSYSININGKSGSLKPADFFIQNAENSFFTVCPFSYFQTSGSLPQKWILDNKAKKLAITNADDFTDLAITSKEQNHESILPIPINVTQGILKYLKQDVYHNFEKYFRFDCYAFVSMVANVRMDTVSPPFTYLKNSPKVGDIVALAENGQLPNVIKHWAICLGKDLFISKFGASTGHAESLLHVSNGQTMMQLYNCTQMFVAKRKSDAQPWSEYVPHYL